MAYHYSTTRFAEFCKETIFSSNEDQNITVHYKRLGEDAAAISAKNSCITFICPDSDKYVFGQPLSQEFIHIVTQDGWTFEQINEFINNYIFIIKAHAKLENIEIDFHSKNETLPGKYFDFIPHNIIIDKDKKAIQIDKEWELNTPIEVTHLLIRVFLLLCNSLTRMGMNANHAALTNFEFIRCSLAANGRMIDESDFDRYLKIENKIQLQVSGVNSSEFFNKWKNNLICTFKLSDVEALNYYKIKELEDKIISIKNSSSWKITKPFRIMSDIVRNVVGK